MNLEKLIYPLNNNTIIVGWTMDWTGSVGSEVQIIGQLKDGRWLCRKAPELMRNVYGEPYWSYGLGDMFLREEVTDIKEKLLEVK